MTTSSSTDPAPEPETGASAPIPLRPRPPARGSVDVARLAAEAREAARHLSGQLRPAKDRAVLEMAEALGRRGEEILAENELDVADARTSHLPDALVDRLRLDDDRLADMARSVHAIAALPDPVGAVIEGRRLPNGLRIERRRVPFGVICVVYEARPNVTSDAAALCVKSGNAILLRGSAMALRTNRILAEVLAGALIEAGLPGSAVQFIDSRDRHDLLALIGDRAHADLVIPRGGEELKKTLREHSRIPVLEAAGGNCHIYVDHGADVAMARRIVVNAKVQRPGVCNAVETLLVHEAAAERFLPAVLADLGAKGVECRLDERAAAIVGGEWPAATEEDWATEYLDLILAIRIVDSVDEAIGHVNQYGSGHSEAIVTASTAAAEQFADQVEAACVYVNASTRFTDGGMFGMGAEIGNSTQKLHARGPIGLEELTTTKWVIHGSGQVR